MKLIYVLIGITCAAALAWLFFNSGLNYSGGEPHQCKYSTNIKDQFCR